MLITIIQPICKFRLLRFNFSFGVFADLAKLCKILADFNSPGQRVAKTRKTNFPAEMKTFYRISIKIQFCCNCFHPFFVAVPEVFGD